MDVTLCSQLAKDVEELTSSGLQELDSNLMKQVKKICKKSDEYVAHAYHLTKHQLETEHAEVRLGALLLCDELFRRSHHFRELLVADFQEFLELTVETDPEQPLPPPVAAAKKLRRTALDFIQQWHTNYGDGYRKLALGYNFLKECKKMDFRDGSIAEQQHVEARLRQTENAHNERLKKLNQEMTEMRIEIDGCLSQINRCIQLVAPKQLGLFDDVDFDAARPCCSKSLPVADDGDDDVTKDWAREHGLIGGNYNLIINVPTDELKVQLTNDNVAIMENLRDLRLTVATRYLPVVTKWTRVIAKCSGPSDQLKKTIDLKNALERTLERCAQLGVDKGNSEITVQSDDEDDDFEEVESKEGLELIIPQHRRAEYGLKPLAADGRNESFQAEPDRDWTLSSVAAERVASDEYQDPTSLVANVKSIEEKITKEHLEIPSTSGITKVDDRKAKLLAKAPKLRFDADLVNWGEKDVTNPSIVTKRDSSHPFWIPSNDDNIELPRKDGISRHSRVSEFAGNFEPVKWQCRAPMPSGRLCPRQDRIKCPLHGRVIPRDSSGAPTNAEDRLRLQRIEEEKQQANPDWQDPALLADIKVATGVDLTITKRRNKANCGKGTKRRKHPGLTDLNAVQSTSRSRLEKKVLNQSSVKRVAATLDDLDHKKFTDKYANQFNYSVQT